MAEMVIVTKEKKVTKREWFEAIKAHIADGAPIADKEGALAFINNEVDLLNRKKSAKSMSPAQVENENTKREILRVLNENGGWMPIPLIMSALNVGGAVVIKSPQHASALLRQMGQSGWVEKGMDKKTTVFKALVAEVDEE